MRTVLVIAAIMLAGSSAGIVFAQTPPPYDCLPAGIEPGDPWGAGPLDYYTDAPPCPVEVQDTWESPEPTVPQLQAADREGVAGFAEPSLGDRYLAIPEGPGVSVTITSPQNGRSIERVSTDAGPSLDMQRKGRVADLSFADFGYLCACDPRGPGLLRVTIEYGGPAPLPATDTE